MQLLQHSSLWLSLILYVIVWAKGNTIGLLDEFQDIGAQNEFTKWVEKLNNDEIKYFCEQLNLKFDTVGKAPPRKVINTNISISTILCDNFILAPTKTGQYLSFNDYENMGQLQMVCNYHPFTKFVLEFRHNNRLYLVRDWLKAMRFDGMQKICKKFNFKFENPRKCEALIVRDAGLDIHSFTCGDGIHLVKSMSGRYYVLHQHVQEQGTLHFVGVATTLKNIPQLPTKYEH